MKNLLLSVLVFSLGLFSCQETDQKSDPKKESKEKADTNTQTKDINNKPEVVSFEEGPNATIKVEDDIKGEEYAGYQDISLNLGLGYKMKADSAWFGGNTYLLDQCQFLKDGKVIYSFPHLDEDMRSISISERNQYGNVPKVLTKGNQTVILIERYLGETEGGIQTDAIVLENESFKKYHKNLDFTGHYQYEPTLDEARKVFDKILKM